MGTYPIERNIVTTESPLPPVIEVVLTIEQMVDWHPIGGTYVEVYWLPTIGPTPWALARRLDLMGNIVGFGEPLEHDTAVLGHMVGVGTAQLGKAIDRLIRFGLASWVNVGGVPRLGVRGAWPPLPRRHHDRLSDFLPPEPVTIQTSERERT